MKVLCVIVHYNNSLLVEGLLANLSQLRKAGSDVEAEVIVVDNSGNLSLFSDENVAIIRPNVNLGYGGAVNVAVLSSVGSEWAAIIVLTQDVEISVAAIRRLAECAVLMEAIVGPALMSDGAVWSLGGRVSRLGRVQHIQESGANERQRDVVQSDWLDGAVMAIPRGAWYEVGGFCSGYFLYKEDADFCLRAKRHGRSVFCLRSVVASQRPSSACHYLAVRNRLLFAKRNLNLLSRTLSLIAVVVSTVEKGRRRPSAWWEYCKDLWWGLLDCSGRQIDTRVIEGGARLTTLSNMSARPRSVTCTDVFGNDRHGEWR